MPISLPRKARMNSGAAPARSIGAPRRGANLRRPPAMRPPPNSTSRMTESEVTDLPEPDSPTTQTVSPGLMVNVTSSTATTIPPSVSNSTLRFSIETSGCGAWRSSRRETCAICSMAARPLPSIRSRIEDVAENVAGHVEAKDGQRHRCAGDEACPGRHVEIVARGLDHQAPRGLRRLRAEAEEGEAGLRQNGEGETD